MITANRRWRLLVLIILVAGRGVPPSFAQESLGDLPVFGPNTQKSNAKDAYTHVLDPLGDRIRSAGAYQESMMRHYEQAMTTEFLFYEGNGKGAGRSGKLRNKLTDSIRKLGTKHILREIQFQEKERTLARKLESDIARNERFMISLAEVPKSVAEIAGGLTMNQLLDVINRRGMEETLFRMPEIPLDESVAKDVRIKLGVGRNAITAPLHSGGDAKLSWEPHWSLMSSDLRPMLDAHEEQRAKLVATARTRSRPSNEDIAAASDTLDCLTAKILDLKPEQITTNTDPAYVSFKEGHKFVKEQSHQIGFLATGDVTRKPFAGQSVQSLILYMTMYGYRFAPAPAGKESSYKVVFDGMVDVLGELREETKSVATSPVNPNGLTNPYPLRRFAPANTGFSYPPFNE